MKKLDWYILKKFLGTFFFSIILFTIISVVVDASEKTDDFVKSGLSTKEIFTTYYAGFVPYIIALLFPLFVLIAVIFFTSKMAGRSEIIAMLASGMSLRRMLRPFVIGGVILALILLVANDYIVPRANELRTNFESKYVNNPNPSYTNHSNLFMRIDSFSYCGIRYYDTITKSGNGFFMQKIKDNKVVFNMRAESIIWDTATKNWRLNNVVEREVNDMGEKLTQVTRKNVNFNFQPSDLQKDEYVKNRLTTKELNRLVKMEKIRGSEGINDLMVEQYRRRATPITVIILTLIAAILASRKIRGGSGVHLAAGIMLGAVFILSDRFSTIFSAKGNLPPIIAAWIPNIIFGILTYYLYRRAPK